MAAKSGKNANNTTPDAADKQQAMPEILDTIRDLESQLSGIREMHADAEVREVELRERAAVLQRREKELGDQARTASKREKELATRLSDFEQSVAETNAARQTEADAIDARERRIEERVASIDRDKRALDEAAETLKQRDAELGQRETALANAQESAETQRQQAESELETLRRESEDSLNARAEELRQQAKEMEQQTELVGQQAAAIEQRAAQIEEAELAAESARSEAAAAQAAAQATAQATAQKEAEELVEQARADAQDILDRAAADAESTIAQARTDAAGQADAARTDALATIGSEQAQLEAEIVEQRAAIEAQREQAESELAEQKTAIEAQREQAESELAEQKTAIEAQREQAESELAEQKTAIEAQREQAETELAEQNAAIETRLADAEQRATDADEREATADERIAALEAKSDEIERSKSSIEEAREAIDAARESLDEERRELELAQIDLGEQEELARKSNKRVSDLERELANLREALSTSAGTSQSAVAKAKTELTNATGRAEEAEHACKLAEQRADRAERRIGELEAGLEHASRDADARSESLEADADAAASERDQLREQIAAANDRVGELESELESVRETAGDGGNLDEAISKRDEAIRILQTRLKAAQQQSPNDEPARPMAPEAVEQRRARLRRYKRLLHNEATKIIQAQEALRKRRDEADKILAERAKLVKLSHSLKKRQKKLAVSKARTGAIAAVFFLTATVGIVGALSWAISAQVAPGQYVATARIAAETRGRGVDEGDLEAWQSYHEQLINDDPQLIEMAAERMQSRGIEELAAPGDLRARIKQDLYSHSERHGVITLELRGQGPDRTQRELDTYATTLVARANAARAQRGDGIATAIEQPAKPSETPLDSERLQVAGMIMGGGSAAAILFGTVIWSRLSRSKRKFDEEQERANAIDQIDWEPPATAG